jgi:AraC-like DNA-binding protein
LLDEVHSDGKNYADCPIDYHRQKISRSRHCPHAVVLEQLSQSLKSLPYKCFDLKDLFLAELRYVVDCTFVSLLTTVEHLMGRRLQLSGAWFRYAAPDNLTEYNRTFQTELRFQAPKHRLIFDANCLNWPVLSSDSDLLMLFEQRAEAMLESMNRMKPYTQQVVQAIVKYLEAELPTIDAIAHSLAISVRQLQRKLHTEGTSFQELLNETHKGLALQYLKNPTIPIHDVTFLLGFSAPSAFNRAFKRWMGQTPRSYRRFSQDTLR